MGKLLHRCCTGLFCAGLLIGAQAQEFRLGFVKTERLLQEAGGAKAAHARLEKEFSKRDKDITAREALLKSAVNQLQVDAPTLSATQRAARERQLTDQDREVQRERRSFQEDLAARKSEELQQLLASTYKVVKQVAEAENYDLVLQDAVYVDRKYDITDKVLKIMNGPGVK